MIAGGATTYEMQVAFGYVRVQFDQRMEDGWVKGYSRRLTYDQKHNLVETGPWEQTGCAYRFD